MAYTIGFIGFGNLAKRLYKGFEPLFKQENACVLYSEYIPLNPEIKNVTLVNLPDLLNQSDIIVLAIKPHQLENIAEQLNTINWDNKCLVSLLAGKSLQNIISKVPSLKHLIRVMPNTSAEFKQSMTVYSFLDSTEKHYRERIHNLFSSVGTCMNIEDSKMDICTALFGSGPAFFYELVNGMQKYMIENDFSEAESRLMINQLFLGVATSINTRTDSIQTLIKEIKSPNGTTQAGLEKMESINITKQFDSVFDAAKIRAKELSNE